MVNDFMVIMRRIKIFIFVSLLFVQSYCLAYKEQKKLIVFDSEKQQEILNALNERGVVMIKNAVAQDKILYLHKTMEIFFSYMDKKAETLTDKDIGYGADSLRVMMGQGGLSLSYRLDGCFDIPKGYRYALKFIAGEGYMNIAKKFFQDEPVLLVEGSSVRRQYPLFKGNSRGLIFHQDGQSGDSSNSGLVFWVPLTPIDSLTPSLQVVNKKIDKIYSHVSDEVGFAVLADVENIMEQYFDDIITVDNMQLGDMLIFDFATLHSTYVIPEMTKTRFSLDIRVMGKKRATELYPMPLSFVE